MVKLLFALSLFFCSLTSTFSMANSLKIETLTKGSGITASTGNWVSVHYKGALVNGEVFDESRPRGRPFRFEIGANQVIPGWEQGVAGMKVGEVRRLTIPPHLGYGAAGAGNVIPPNATLIFEIELIDIREPIKLSQATPETFKTAQKDGAVIIDIRRKEEWIDTGIIENAITITAFQKSGNIHPEFQKRFFSVAPSQETPIMLYCRTGNRTTSLGIALIDQLGYTNISHLKDGITGWIADGHKVVNYQE